MKTTKNFNLQVPELGDRPNITQVSNAIEALEDASSGNIEVVKATINGNKLTLLPIVRTTSRRAYYNGLTLHFKAPSIIQPNALATVKLDNLPEQVLSIPFLVNAGDMVELVYNNNKFDAVYFTVPKSSSTSSTSEVNVATSKAVKTAYDRGTEAYNLANTKEPKIVKNSGFNLPKSDVTNSTDSSVLATSKAVKKAYDRGSQAYDLANTKEPKFSKYSAFNKNFGTSSGTVMEGKRLAEILGIPYGGILNNSNSKVAGTAYYDNTTKKTYKCTSTTSLNYAESTKFEAISNNDLLLKFQNFNIFSSQSLQENGYITLQGGLIIQWGKKYSSSLSSGTVTYPIVFPNSTLNVTITQIGTGGTNDNNVDSITTSGFKFHQVDAGKSVYWQAIGY